MTAMTPQVDSQPIDRVDMVRTEGRELTGAATAVAAGALATAGGFGVEAFRRGMIGEVGSLGRQVKLDALLHYGNVAGELSTVGDGGMFAFVGDILSAGTQVVGMFDAELQRIAAETFNRGPAMPAEIGTQAVLEPALKLGGVALMGLGAVKFVKWLMDKRANRNILNAAREEQLDEFGWTQLTTAVNQY